MGWDDKFCPGRTSSVKDCPNHLALPPLPVATRVAAEKRSRHKISTKSSCGFYHTFCLCTDYRISTVLIILVCVNWKIRQKRPEKANGMNRKLTTLFVMSVGVLTIQETLWIHSVANQSTVRFANQSKPVWYGYV